MLWNPKVSTVTIKACHLNILSLFNPSYAQGYFFGGTRRKAV
jgi:hypothetical protein